MMLKHLLLLPQRFSPKKLLYSKRIVICSVLVFSQLLTFSQNTEIELYKTFTGRYNYTMIGNSFNTFENTFHSQNECTFKSSASDVLNLQANDKVVAAYLYWSTYTYYYVNYLVDRVVELNGTSFTADTVYTNTSKSVYACRADITDFIKKNGNKTYTMNWSSINNYLITYCTQKTYKGWAVLIIYENENLPLSSIFMSEGFESVYEGNIDIEVRDVNVTAVENSHLAFLAWEGDANLVEDEIIYFDTIFPPEQIFKRKTFNNTHSFHDPPTTIYNMDLDNFDLSKNIKIGLNQDFHIRLKTGNDLVHVNAVIFSVNNVKPNPSAKVDSVSRNCGNNNSITMKYEVVNKKSSQALPTGVKIKVWADSIGKTLLYDTVTTAEIPIDTSHNFTVTFSSPVNIADISKVILTVNLDSQGNVIIPDLDTTDNIYTKTLESVIKIRANASDTEICKGEQVTLNAISNGDVIEWNNRVINNVDFTPESTATYVATAMDTTLGCEATDSITITVHPPPKLSLTVAMNDTAICFLDSVLVSASGADSISWNYGLENGEYFVPSDTGNFTLVAKGFNPSLICESDTLWDTVIVRVASKTKLTLAISSPTKNKTICFGDSVLVSASGAVSILWNYGLKNDDYFVPGDTGIYNLIATARNLPSCLTGTSADTISVYVHPIPTLLINEGPQIICKGDDFPQISVESKYQVNWYNDSIKGDLIQENSYTYTLKDTQSVYAEAVDLQSGCISKSRTEASVKYFPDIPPISIYAPRSEIYRGESAKLMIKNYDINNSLKWNTGAKDTSITVTPAKTSLYGVTSSSKCGVKKDSLLLKVIQWNINLGEDRHLCTTPQSITLQPKLFHKADRGDEARLHPLVTYLWNTNDTVPVITVEVDSTSVYTLSATIGNYTQSDAIKIQESDLTFAKSLISGCFTFIDVEIAGGVPPYQYSLDNVNFQDDNRFVNITPQEYTLYVRDDKGCMIDTFIFVNSIDVPNFFTPNGDGINDVWRVRGLENCEDAVIMISDRYSRLVKQMKTDEYWDGIYMNMLMHNDTYWNMIDFRDGVNKTMKNRITIVR